MLRRATRWLVLAGLLLPGAAHAAPDLPVMLYEPGINPQTFLPVSYLCPPTRKGVIELTKMNVTGGRVRVRVTFDGETATNALVQRALRNTPFETWHEFVDPTRKRPDDEAARNILQVVLMDADAIRMLICFGQPAIREKYDKILEHNRKHLGPARPD